MASEGATPAKPGAGRWLIGGLVLLVPAVVFALLGTQGQVSAVRPADQKFLTENKAKDGVVTTASGLQYKVLRPGKGPRPGANDWVQVHYVGRLVDGTTFDSSYARGTPAVFQLGDVIPGWREGLQLMNAGARYQLVIPSALGYGPAGQGPIPPGATLVFDVELLGVAPAER
ncbi:MAG: FKBP-type peptidyl-prolyl cis-trans isomerase [Sphingomonadales bacterium]|jgi:FKBP-type peptidyl-prolyl cis-trans isomerase